MPAKFLYVGMLRDLKGPDIFVDAFAKTERMLKRPLSAMMIGDGPQKQKYLDMMTVRGLGRRITMLPAMNIREAFALSHTVVVPSRAESMPYIVLESLAAGKHRDRLRCRRHLRSAGQVERRRLCPRQTAMHWPAPWPTA